MANRRKARGPFDKAEVRELLDAHHHAAAIGRPLDMMLTVRPAFVDDLDDAARCTYFSSLINRLGVWYRRRGHRLTSVYVREANPEGRARGEHLHALIHCPRDLVLDLQEALRRWHPGTEADLRPATDRKFSPTGRVRDAVGYLIKVATPQATWGTNRSRRFKGGDGTGVIVGRRGNTTRDLSFSARAAWQEARDARDRLARSARGVA